MSLHPDRMTRDQQNLMYSMLRDVSHQCKLIINGKEVQGDIDDWKDVFTAALKKHHRIASGLDGGYVILGMRTSKLNKDQMGELIDLIGAYGSEKGVKWTDLQASIRAAKSGGFSVLEWLLFVGITGVIMAVFVARPNVLVALLILIAVAFLALSWACAKSLMNKDRDDKRL